MVWSNAVIKQLPGHRLWPLWSWLIFPVPPNPGNDLQDMAEPFQAQQGAPWAPSPVLGRDQVRICPKPRAAKLRRKVQFSLGKLQVEMWMWNCTANPHGWSPQKTECTLSAPTSSVYPDFLGPGRYLYWIRSRYFWLICNFSFMWFFCLCVFVCLFVFKDEMWLCLFRLLLVLVCNGRFFTSAPKKYLGGS